MQRPRQIEKRDTILQAAAQLFLQNGYSRVSVDEVVAAIGGSKRTIYAYFGDKDGLFASIVEQLCNEIVTPLVVLDIKRLPLRDALQRIASTFLDVVLSPKAIALHRLVIAEANRAPESARMFFAAAPTTSYRCLADYFNWADGAGLVTPGDAQARAVIFLDALTGDLQLRCLLGLLSTPSQAEKDRLITQAIEIFLGGVASAEYSSMN